jgi:type I restriction enzyme, R subunit
MAHALYEHEIESRCVELLMQELAYDAHLNLWELPDDGNLAFGRDSAKEVINKKWLTAALQKLNPYAPTAVRDAAMEEIIRYETYGNMLSLNKKMHQLLTEGFEANISSIQGVSEPHRIKLIDFQQPENNHFAIVQQLTIRGKQTRRPDLLIYVNGLPLIFIELKNLTEPTKTAFDKNVSDYKRDISNLFHFNLLLILSNVSDTKIGSLSSDWEHYFNWEKVDSEQDLVVPQGQEDLPQVLRGLCRKEVMIDLLENFVLYYLDKSKIVAKNHQYLGVNNAVAAYEKRAHLEGKLGVFWHTQGSGKSFSMVFFVQKLLKQFGRQQKFVIITDREDLENQILTEFERTNLIPSQKKDKKDKDSKKERGVKALNSADLQVRLQSNDRFVFTLIQKFNTKSKGTVYPTLNESTDIVVIVDEAHRSQYNDLAQNMRRAMPNAQYIAFTGTPLLDSNESTKQWFGEYVSRYDFSDSIADGSTVRLFHQNRVPQLQIINDRLNEEIAQIFSDENLSEEQQEKIIREKSEITTLLADSDRLQEVAKDIVKHFVGRGYLGKAMVVSSLKEISVKMYVFVQKAWSDYKKEQLKLRNGLPSDSPLRTQIDRTLKFMSDTEMAVVISYTGTDEEDFLKKGMDLRPHIAKMNKVGAGYETIEDRFKAINDPLRLVFVCAKWLTGFDAPTVSTLYLDKPLQKHTLMQTIARANRVAPALNSLGYKADTDSLDRVEKEAGMIIDYIDVFENLQKALADYGKARDNNDKEANKPLQYEDLIAYLDAAITEGIALLEKENLDIREIMESEDTFDKIKLFQTFADTLSQTDEQKKTFAVHQNAISAFYQACKPDINNEENLPSGEYIGKYKRTRDAFEYLRNIIKGKDKQNSDFSAASQQIDNLIDEAIVAKNYIIKPEQEIDLSGIDLEKLQEKFEQTPYKRLAINDLVAFLQEQVQKLLARNVTRIDLAQRLQDLIDAYNTRGSDVKQFFKELREYAATLRQEEIRSVAEGLTEEELEIFDLLFQEKLSVAEKQKVKLAAKALLQKLKDNDIKRSIMVTDWHRNAQSQVKVRKLIGDVLDENLPQESYDKNLFNEKLTAVYTHIYNTATLGARYWA